MSVKVLIQDGNKIQTCEKMEDVSDGYHTFKELYTHRIVLFIALMLSHSDLSWWSRKHADGSMYEGGWIVAGISLPMGDVTYHMPDSYIEMLKTIDEFELAPKWDGHTPEDVVKRLEAWIVWQNV